MHLEMGPDDYRGPTAYARAKRAQVVLSEEWAKRLRDAGVAVHAMHPGWADTPGLEVGLPAFRTADRTRCFERRTKAPTRSCGSPRPPSRAARPASSGSTARRVPPRSWSDRTPRRQRTSDVVGALRTAHGAGRQRLADRVRLRAHALERRTAGGGTRGDAGVGIEQRGAVRHPERGPLRRRRGHRACDLRRRAASRVRRCVDVRRGTAPPSSTSASARSVAYSPASAHAARIASVSKRSGRDGAGERRQHQLDRVRRVERRFLVLLQIAVIPQREALEERRDRDEVTGDPRRLARASSAVSGFRFCGIMLDPVEYASSRLAHPSAGSVHRARSAASLDACVAVIATTAMNSCTKSRSLTASIEFANACRMPSRCAVAAGSRPRVEVAVAPAPSAETDVRSAHCDAALQVAQHRPRVREQVMAQRHRLGEPCMRRARHHGGSRVRVRGSPGFGPARRVAASIDRPCVEQPQPQVGDHQIVARSACVELGPERTQTLGDRPFDDRMHVLVARDRTSTGRRRCRRRPR